MYLNQKRYSLRNLTIGLLDILCSIFVVVIASSALSTLVNCRSYNNGLVFYDLHTHGTYLPPTVSVSRGRSLANFIYSDKGSIWSTFGQPCECANKVCGCCAGLQVEQYNFNQKICANVTFVPDAEEAQLEVYLNEKSSAKYGLSARNPSPFCIPVMMGVPMGMCVQMSNIQMVGNNLNMCMDFVVRLASTDLFEMHFQCMRMGLDGLQYLDKNGQPVLPQSSHDDDYDFFDENSSPLDSDSNADEEASAAEYYEELEKQQQKYEVVKLDVKDQNQKELKEEQEKKSEKHEEKLEKQEEPLFQIKGPLTEDILSQSNIVEKDPIVATQNSIVKNESEMINSTINANNANNLVHGYADGHDDKVNDDNKVIVAINASTIALSNNEDGDSNSNGNGNGNDEQSDNNSKQNELITTTMTKSSATTTIKTPTTTTTITDQDEEMPNYMANDNIQSAAPAATTTVNGGTTVNSSTVDLKLDRESMAQDEETENEDNNSDDDNDDDDEKTTTTSSAASDATEENSRNEINIDDEGNEEVDDVEEDDGEKEEEEEEHENNDLDNQIDMINNESVTNNDNYILNDANANMANECVNVTANQHKVGIDDLNNDLNNDNNDDHGDDDDGAEDNDGNGLYNDNDNSNVDNIDTNANDDDYDDDSYQNSLNDIENTLTLPQLRSLNSNKFYRYIHRF